MAEIADERLTSGEAAALLDVTIHTINKWANEGKLPHYRTLGGHRRFRRREIEALRDAWDASASEAPKVVA